MKKKIIVFISSLIIMVSPLFILNASADSIQAIMPEPVPVYEVVNNEAHVVFYWVSSLQGTICLTEYNAYFPLSTHFIVQSTRLFFDNQPNSGSIVNYNIQTGSLVATESADGVYINVNNPFLNPPVYYKWCNSTQNNGFFPINENIQINNQGSPLYDIVWGTNSIPVVYHRSFLPEPVCDEYNRYFVLAGDENEYIYVLRYFMSESYIYQVENSISPNNTVQAFLRNLVCPYVDLNNNGLQLSLNVDSDLFALLNATTQSTYLFYDLQVAKYNLIDGQFLQSWVYTDIEMSDDPVVLDVDLGDAEDYDSAQFWGVMFQDTSTRYHYNLLACSWAQDPDFISWRQSIENYLDLIYSILSESEESATIEQDTSGMDEMMSARDALEVTDSNGDPVDPAQQVEVAFSQAAEGLSQVAPGVVSVNNLITQLFATHPLVTVPIIVALALGLIVTILGKDKSD